MPLGIVNDNEFETELIKLGIIKKNVISSEVEPLDGRNLNGEVIDIKHGRGNKEETPEIVRNIVAECALDGASHKELVRLFDVSPASVSAYKNSATSTATYNQPDDKLKAHTNQVRARISRKASNRMMAALNCITAEKLADVKPRDAAAIAKDMSAVIRNIEPQHERDSEAGPQFVIYAPQLRQEVDYQIIHVNE